MSGKLCRLLFAAFALFMSVNAFALIPKVSGYYVQKQYGYQPTPEGACTAVPPSTIGAGYMYKEVKFNSGAGQWYCFWSTASGTISSLSVNEVPAGACPANSTLSGSSCQCNAGYAENAAHTACVAPLSELEQFCKDHAALKNTFPQFGTIGTTSPTPEASCYKPQPPFQGVDATKGCAMALTDQLKAPTEPGLMGWSATGVMTGATCEDAAATDAAPKSLPDPCPSGFPGTVNGVAKCVPIEPDKGIEGVKGTSETKADGTKIDTKETTKCNGSVCTTTTTATTTTSTGSVSTSTSSRTESLGDKCLADPKNQVCQKTQGGAGGKVSQGNCSENPSATGCGGEGAEIGDLYTKKDKTVAQALTKAKDALQASPLGSSVSGFFSVGAGGSCPTSSASIPFINKTIVIDAWCTTFAANMFNVVRAVLLMLATWMAFRIAIDN